MKKRIIMIIVTAAQKPLDMGCTDICEFGGINDWTGEIVTEEYTIRTAKEQPLSVRIVK